VIVSACLDSPWAPLISSAWLSLSLCAAGLVTAIANAAPAERLIFLSTQHRPIEEAQKMRNLILKSFPQAVDYITEQPQQFPVRIEAKQEGGITRLSSKSGRHWCGSSKRCSADTGRNRSNG
jgi:multiple sugar transport system substrate-binding protein